MLNLKRGELAIVFFLTISLISILTISAYQKTHRIKDLYLTSFTAADGARITDSKIDLNKASIGDLMRLKGIGKTLASRIIEYRNTKGAFYDISEIKEVKGVGEKLFENIKDKIVVE